MCDVIQYIYECDIVSNYLYVANVCIPSHTLSKMHIEPILLFRLCWLVISQNGYYNSWVRCKHHHYQTRLEEKQKIFPGEFCHSDGRCSWHDRNTFDVAWALSTWKHIACVIIINAHKEGDAAQAAYKHWPGLKIQDTVEHLCNVNREIPNVVSQTSSTTHEAPLMRVGPWFAIAYPLYDMVCTKRLRIYC